MQNGCVTIAKTASEVRLLKIDGYSLTAMDKDACIKSIWSVDGFDWEIHFFPALPIIGGVQCVQLKLIFLSKSRMCSVKASLKCQLVDPSGKLKPYQEKSVFQSFSRPEEQSGALILSTRNDISSLGYVKDDCLFVQCTITVLKEHPEPVIATAPVKELHQHFGELLQKSTRTDVTLVVSGESFAAHKVVLAARSPVFMAEFFGNMKEAKSATVEVDDDMEPVAFKAMLHFIYTDTVPELDQQGEEESVTKMAMHLLVASDRYGFDKLKLICEGKLSDAIDVDTAATTLALAEQHGCSLLKAKCVEFIITAPANLDAVMATEGYKHLEKSCPLVLSDLLKSQGCARKQELK